MRELDIPGIITTSGLPSVPWFTTLKRAGANVTAGGQSRMGLRNQRGGPPRKNKSNGGAKTKCFHDRTPIELHN